MAKDALLAGTLVLRALGAAYAAMGRYSKQRMSRCKGSSWPAPIPNTPLADKFGRELLLYKAGHGYESAPAGAAASP